MTDVAIESANQLTKDIADVIVLLEKQVFATPLSLTILENEIRGQSNCLISIAYDSAKPVGFKIGYEYHSDHEYFYSWNGGVLPAYRRRGIARRLMLQQHEFAKKHGYKYIRTHTKNKYRSMLLFNIAEGFDVTGVYKKLREESHGIILEKKL